MVNLANVETRALISTSSPVLEGLNPAGDIGGTAEKEVDRVAAGLFCGG